MWVRSLSLIVPVTIQETKTDRLWLGRVESSRERMPHVRLFMSCEIPIVIIWKGCDYFCEFADMVRHILLSLCRSQVVVPFRFDNLLTTLLKFEDREIIINFTWLS